MGGELPLTCCVSLGKLLLFGPCPGDSIRPGLSAGGPGRAGSAAGTERTWGLSGKTRNKPSHPHGPPPSSMKSVSSHRREGFSGKLKGRMTSTSGGSLTEQRGPLRSSRSCVQRKWSRRALGEGGRRSCSQNSRGGRADIWISWC